jgi:DNA-binding CsgD family transcriptional regulator
VTDRERQVMRLVCQGHTPKEIAARLSISHHTVKEHLKNVNRRLGARNGKHAVALFLEAS